MVPCVQAEGSVFSATQLKSDLAFYRSYSLPSRGHADNKFCHSEKDNSFTRWLSRLAMLTIRAVAPYQIQPISAFSKVNCFDCYFLLECCIPEGGTRKVDELSGTKDVLLSLYSPLVNFRGVIHPLPVKCRTLSRGVSAFEGRLIGSCPPATTRVLAT